MSNEPSRRPFPRDELLRTGAGLLAGLVALFALQGLGVQSGLVLALGAYAAFACTMFALRRVLQQRTLRSDAVIDLRDYEHAHHPPVAEPTPTEALLSSYAVATPAGLTLPPPPPPGLYAPPPPLPPPVGPSTPESPAPAFDIYDVPQERRAITGRDVSDFLLAASAAVAFALMQQVVTDSYNMVGGTLVWFLAFMTIYYTIVRDQYEGEAAADRIVTVLVWSAGLAVVSVLVWMLAFLLIKGLPALRPGFFTEDLSTVGPLDPGGGAFHAIVGSFEQVGIATAVVVPVAILTAVYLHEIGGRLARPVRFIIDAMAGLPSIVAGLFIFTLVVDGRGFTGIAASLALIVLMLPTVTRASEEILRTVPDGLRESSLALGAPQWRVVSRVVLPTARAGLVTAVILGIARAVGETAPALLTALGSDTTNWNPFHGPQEDLPLFVWKLITLPNEVQKDRGYTGLLILVILVLVLFLTARWVANRGARRLGRAR
jgi:phosphate transport system permease protein